MDFRHSDVCTRQCRQGFPVTEQKFLLVLSKMHKLRKVKTDLDLISWPTFLFLMVILVGVALSHSTTSIKHDMLYERQINKPIFLIRLHISKKLTIRICYRKFPFSIFHFYIHASIFSKY